jgi:hypothetical protein
MTAEELAHTPGVTLEEQEVLRSCHFVPVGVCYFRSGRTVVQRVVWAENASSYFVGYDLVSTNLVAKSRIIVMKPYAPDTRLTI